MRVMIHACPNRMWYVEDFMLPELDRQGIENVIVWNDAKRKGNLISCMESFATCEGDGGTWHLQDDVLLCRDFAERIEALPTDRIICGFVNEYGGPDCNLRGDVYAADMWYSFPCIFIPNRIARECSEWFISGDWKRDANALTYAVIGDDFSRGDDYFFREFVEIRHGTETVLNLAPCLVEHVDWLVGGSVVNAYRGFKARAVYWDDEDLVDDLKNRIKAHQMR